MWEQISQSRNPWRSLGKILTIPALLGLLVAPSVVFWIPSGLWPNIFTVSCGYLALILFAILMTRNIARRLTTQGELEIEELFSTLGMYLAILIGIFHFGLEPSQWKESAQPEQQESATVAPSSKEEVLL